MKNAALNIPANATEMSAKIYQKKGKIIKKSIDIPAQVCYNIDTTKGKEVKPMGETNNMQGIEKALRELAKAVEENEAVERIKIQVTLKKPKPDKAKPKS